MAQCVKTRDINRTKLIEEKDAYAKEKRELEKELLQLYLPVRVMLAWPWYGWSLDPICKVPVSVIAIEEADNEMSLLP